MVEIRSVKAREMLDSRGNPTVECSVTLDDGTEASAAVPSGATTGSHEALELRDGGKRFHGKGVLKAVSNVNERISPKIEGMPVEKQKEVDGLLVELDCTKDKSRLGANAVLSVSLAVSRAGAIFSGKPLYSYIASSYGFKPEFLPVPFANVINGGGHAGNELSLQELMIAPVGAKSFSEAAQMVSEIYRELREGLLKKYGKSAVNVGDEGGFAPPMAESAQALDEIEEAIKSLGYSKKVKLALDCAASEFYSKGKYSVEGKRLSAGELADHYSQLLSSHPVVSIEDPFHEDDFASFASFTKKFGRKIQVVGDDLLVTNAERVKKAVKQKSCNALLLKMNQVGTLSESVEAAKLAYASDWNVMVSHRSGETCDAFISDLAVALNCRQIKLGAPCRSERTSKYNRLLSIESNLEGAKYKWMR